MRQLLILSSGQDIEVEEEDEGYSSVNRHQSRSSRRARWVATCYWKGVRSDGDRWGGGTIETDLEEGQTIEEVKQRFSLLKEAYEEMRGIEMNHGASKNNLFRPNDEN